MPRLPRIRPEAKSLSPKTVGEAIPTVGKPVAAGHEGYAGIIAVGPFNCLPFRMSKAREKPRRAFL